MTRSLMPKDAHPTLLLVDGNNLVYRSFFAIPPLANRAGMPTNAVYGFANVLRKILADEAPPFAAVSFDAGGKTFRHERFEAYKANRPPVPDDLKQQIPYTRKLCEALGLPILEARGIEADDIIGTLTRRATEAGYRVLILSSDKDLLQLVSDDVTVIHPVKYDRLDPEGVRAKLGVPPERVVDVLALMGDSVDNIPGVQGIGEKGAVKLVNEWGSLESILDNASQVKNKRQREALEQYGEGARLSKELVTIATDLDLDSSSTAISNRSPIGVPIATPLTASSKSSVSPLSSKTIFPRRRSISPQLSPPSSARRTSPGFSPGRGRRSGSPSGSMSERRERRERRERGERRASTPGGRISEQSGSRTRRGRESTCERTGDRASGRSSPAWPLS